MVRTPGGDELEVSVFGSGVGESIVVHLGAERWLIVDSCRNSRTGEVQALDYLTSLGVDVGTQVDWVIATHAHDDHIQGLGETVRACTDASVVLPAAATVEDFLALSHLDARLEFYDTRWRIYREIEEVVSELELSGRLNAKLHYVLEGVRLPLANAITAQDGPDLLFVAPSSHAVTLSKRAFAYVVHRAVHSQHGGRLTRRDPNTFSSALLIKALDQAVLLGGDVLTGRSGWGWNRAVAVFQCDDVEVFKVPHHGAPNAHHDAIWAGWLRADAVAIVAPYRPSRRPRAEDIRRMRSYGKPVWTTAGSERIAQSKQARGTAAKVRQVARNVEESGGLPGRVTYRRRSGESARVQGFGRAFAYP